MTLFLSPLLLSSKPMQKTSAAAVHQDDPIWLSLSRYVIGPADASFSFSARLARENGWSATHTQRVLLEYRRFCYLAATELEAVTPSDAVDQACTCT